MNNGSLRFIANFGINLSGNNLLRFKKLFFLLCCLWSTSLPPNGNGRGKKFSVQPGQTITSLQHIAERCGKGVNAGNVRGALDRFVKLGFLANESTKTGRLLTVVNWGAYQYLDDERCTADCKDLTKAMQSDCKGSASNKKNKKEEKDKKNNFLSKLFFYFLFPTSQTRTFCWCSTNPCFSAGRLP